MKTEDQCVFCLLKKMKMALCLEDTDGSVCQLISTKAQCASSSLPKGKGGGLCCLSSYPCHKAQSSTFYS